MILDTPDYLTHDEIRQLLQAIDDTRDRAIVILFLTTGLFLNEMADLTVDDLDWTNHTIQILGKRNRTIPLSNECHDALALWSQERITTPQTNAFFLRTKGKPTGLTSRGLDDLVRRYGEKAGFQNPINAHILRNTFAVRLFQSGIDEKTAIQQLGISDPESIARYKRNLSDVQPQDQKQSTSDIGLRTPDNPLIEHSKLTQFINKFFPIYPKIIKGNPNIEPVTADNLMIGRDSVIKELKADLNKGQSILLTGQLGTGKSHLLKYLAKEYQNQALYFSSPTPIKQLFITILTHSQFDANSLRRKSTQDLFKLVIENKPLIVPILIIDNLQKLKISDLDMFLALLAHFPILGTTDELIPRLKILWWKFKMTELQPLTEEHSKQLLKLLTQGFAISDYEFLETRILQLANGLPVSIVDMVNQLKYKNIVNRDAIRGLYHDAGIHYREWSSLLIIFWGLLIMSRFIALGTHSFEGYILAGLGTSVFLVLKYFMQRMKS